MKPPKIINNQSTLIEARDFREEEVLKEIKRTRTRASPYEERHHSGPLGRLHIEQGKGYRDAFFNPNTEIDDCSRIEISEEDFLILSTISVLK